MDLYEKNHLEKECLQNQPEASIGPAYNHEMGLQEKENLFKEIYSNIRLFEKLVYEARKTPDKRN